MLLLRLVLMALVILGIAHIVPGIEVPNFGSAVMFACVLALMNGFIRPILLVLTLPVTLLTIGLFALIINGLTFWMAGELSFGVHITSFWGAFWGGLISWIASGALSWTRQSPPKTTRTGSPEIDPYVGCTIDIETGDNKK